MKSSQFWLKVVDVESKCIQHDCYKSHEKKCARSVLDIALPVRDIDFHQVDHFKTVISLLDVSFPKFYQNWYGSAII